MVVLGGGAVSYERGTPVWAWRRARFGTVGVLMSADDGVHARDSLIHARRLTDRGVSWSVYVRLKKSPPESAVVCWTDCAVQTTGGEAEAVHHRLCPLHARGRRHRQEGD